MDSKQKATSPLTEEMLRDNPKLLQVLTEQQRYKQQCRLRALDLAFQETSRINDPLMSQQNNLRNPDYLTKADKYYEWLIKIIIEK